MAHSFDNRANNHGAEKFSKQGQAKRQLEKAQRVQNGMKEYLFIRETVFVGIAHDCFFALKSPNFLTNGVKVCTPPKDAPSL